jgi:hypothetical protein
MARNAAPRYSGVAQKGLCLVEAYVYLSVQLTEHLIADHELGENEFDSAPASNCSIYQLF